MSSPFCKPFREAEKALESATNAMREHKTAKKDRHLTAALYH